ncbi:hypothetical protein [Streptomyces sp. NPDC054958]
MSTAENIGAPLSVFNMNVFKIDASPPARKARPRSSINGRHIFDSIDAGQPEPFPARQRPDGSSLGNDVSDADHRARVTPYGRTGAPFRLLDGDAPASN